MMIIRLLAPLTLFALATPPASAQLIAEPDTEAEAAPAADLFGRETPRATVTGLLDALAAQDYTRAANYFELPSGDEADLAEQGAALARQLQTALDGGGTLLAFAVLSNNSEGRVDDMLPPGQEQVGTLGGEERTPILLSRSEAAEGAPVWRISPETIAELAELAELQDQARAPEAGAPVGEASTTFAGAPLWDWVRLLGAAAASFLFYWTIFAGILWLMRRVIKDCDKSIVYRLSHAALPPLSLFAAVVGFQFWASSIEASIVARQMLLRYIGVVAWVALVWFVFRLVDAVAGLVTARMERQERRQAVSVVSLLRRTAKVLLLVVAMVAILDTLGFDVTTGIAALGIGGIALALGAQKTIENLVGSISVIADKPVQVGDFCRVGTVTGTVEDIGIRSTRIRTLERTIVTIPNSDFSSQQIENYASRDRFLFKPTIGVEYGISAAKLRDGVELIERILLAHEKVDSDGARARFIDFGPSSLDIEVFSYIMVSDFNESLVIRQELLLQIFQQLEAAGLSIAFPTRKVLLVQEPDNPSPSEAVRPTPR